MGIGKFFYEHPVFRLDELSKWKIGHGAHNKRAIHALIQHYLKADRLCRVRRALYAVVPPNTTAKDLSVDPYLIAGKVANDSILGFHTALELFGVAYSSFERFTYLSEQKIKPFDFQGQWFQPVIPSTHLRTKGNIFFEVETINRQGIELRVTSLARTFVDVLGRIELSGGWEEVIRSINQIATLNIDRVIDYCLKLNNPVLTAKVGYFLEQRQGAFVPTDRQVKMLLQQKPSSPQYLSKKPIERCRLIKKWNIMMPIIVIEKSWEEPEHDV